MSKNEFLTIFFLILLVNSQLLQAYYIQDHPSSISSLVNSNDTYIWLWQEFEDAPGSIQGEDFVFWGESLGPYHNYTELTEKLVHLNNSYSSLVELFSIGTTWEGNQIWSVRLTNESITSAKTEYYIVGAHHARELISVENTLYFIDWIIYNAFYGSEFHELLQTKEIYVIPMLNPDGVSILHWYPEQRKNLAKIDDDDDGSLEDELEEVYYWDETDNISRVRSINLDGNNGIGEDRPGGIDLNRNYPAFWGGLGASPIPVWDDYRGPNPLSEPETLSMKQFMYNHSFNFAVSLHSGIQAIISPWSHNGSIPLKDQAEYNALLLSLKEISGFDLWNETTAGYVVSGDWGDYSYLYHDILSFTIETYGGGIFYHYYDYFNPPADQVLNLSEEIFDSLIFLASEPQLTYQNSLPSIKVENPSKINQVFDNYTITWSASDAEDDALNASIFVSTDGLYWDLIANNLTNQYTYIWDLEGVKAGKYYIKVAISDGTNWIKDETEIKLNVRDEPEQKPYVFWIAAGIFGFLAALYYFINIRKTKDIEKTWGKRTEK